MFERKLALKAQRLVILARFWENDYFRNNLVDELVLIATRFTLKYFLQPYLGSHVILTNKSMGSVVGTYSRPHKEGEKVLLTLNARSGSVGFNNLAETSKLNETERNVSFLWRTLLFLWRVCSHVWETCVLYAHNRHTTLNPRLMWGYIPRKKRVQRSSYCSGITRTREHGHDNNKKSIVIP
jgi:hypothetical protein